MQTVGIRELKERTSEILRRVREDGQTIRITYRGEVIARISPEPAGHSTAEETAAIWADLRQLAQEVGKRWPAGVSAVAAVREEGESIAVTQPEAPRAATAAALAQIDRLAAEIGACWPEGVSAVDAVREDRREL